MILTGDPNQVKGKSSMKEISRCIGFNRASMSLLTITLLFVDTTQQ